MYNLMSDKVDELYRIRVLQKCFFCLNTKLSLKLTYEQRKQKFCYKYIRALSDVEQISKRYFARRRHSLSYIIRKYQTKSQSLLKKCAKKSVNFKSFITTTESDIELRTMTEQKLMLTAFENRGTLQYNDINVNSSMPKITGDKFSDPKPTYPLNYECKSDHTIIPTGFSLSKIKIAIQNGLGIVGWQLFWSADCCVPIESLIRGKVVGNSIIQHEYLIKQFDFLLEVEYCTEGAVIVGIRFFTYLTGWSKWIGNRGNQLSKKYRLNCNNAESIPNESKYKSSGYQETISPGMPSEYIIGFSGLESTVRATGLGIIVRRVSLQNIFSYHWVNESIYFTKLKQANELSMSTSNFKDSIDGINEDNINGITSTTGSNSINNNNNNSNNNNNNNQTILPAINGANSSSIVNSNNNYFNNRPLSASQRRSMDLIRHLSDLQTEQFPSSLSNKTIHNETDYLDSIESNMPILKPSEEQFFDVIRMRSVEIKSAQIRALNFARNLWSNIKIRLHSEYYIFSTIKVLTPFIKW